MRVMEVRGGGGQADNPRGVSAHVIITLSGRRANGERTILIHSRHFG